MLSEYCVYEGGRGCIPCVPLARATCLECAHFPGLDCSNWLLDASAIDFHRFS